MKNKFLALVVVMCMALTMIPGVALADTYTEWNDGTTLPTSGTYKLITDVTLSSKLTVSQTLKLDLNGHTVYANAEISVGNAGTLIIEDIAGGGKITNSNASYTSGNILYIMGNCQIDGGTIENTKSSGVALFVNWGNSYGNAASCTMNGGTILNAYDKSGRAVKVNNRATFTMNGGTVENMAAGTDGTVPAIEGGASSSKIVINDGSTIESGGTGIQSSGSPVEISGGKIEADFYALQTRYATVDGTVELTADKALLKPYSAPSSGDGNVIKGGTFNAPALIASSTTGGNETNALISGGSFSGGGNPSTHTGDTLVAKVGSDIIIVGEENIEKAANESQTPVTIEPISGTGDLDLDSSNGNQVVITDEMKDNVTINGQSLEPQASDAPQGIPSRPQTTTPVPENKPSGSGISVTYNGGNSFSTSKSDVPTGVEIDGVAVPFSGTGSNFTVGCIDPNAKWVTVRWNSTSVTTNFTPDAFVGCATVSIPKTGDVSLWAAVLAFFGF